MNAQVVLVTGQTLALALIGLAVVLAMRLLPRQPQVIRLEVSGSVRLAGAQAAPAWMGRVLAAGKVAANGLEAQVNGVELVLPFKCRPGTPVELRLMRE